MNYQQAILNLSKNNSKQNVEKQIDLLLSEMTLKEKIRLTYGINPVRFMARMLNGVARGSFLRNAFLGGGCKRLGIPQIVFSDGPRGSVIERNTCFPAAMLRSAIFDDEFEYKVGKAIAKEVIASGGNYFAGICLNIVRNPRWGRAQETYGEDPFKLGRAGEVLTKAVQEEGVIACPKHFALNSIENLRFQVSANVDERALREIYLPHFKKCVDAGAMAMMSAYNRVNGTYCDLNKHLLTDILRDEWGFEGFVMSDFVSGVHDCVGSYDAGMDMEMPWKTHHKKAEKLIKEGKMDEKLINQASRRILRSLLSINSKLKPQPKSISKCKEHANLAREAATKGTVLLKNNGVLPVSLNQKIAVVGPFADAINTGDHGSSFIWCKDGITPYQGLKNVYKDVSVYNGLETDPALKAAKNADVVVVCVGCDRFTEGELLENKIETLEKDPSKKSGGDRDSLHLRSEELSIIKALKDAGKKVIVSMITGSVFVTGDFEDSVDGVFLSFYGGVHAGTALADLISGKANPSGKLPVTIAKDEKDYPDFIEIGQKPYEIDYGYYLGYMLFDKKGIEPQHPFGFGLSYTTFEFGLPKMTKSETGFNLEVSVKNTGTCHGAEVVQVYVGSVGATEDRPVKQLKGYQRVELEPGEQKDVSVHVESKDLMFYSATTKEWSLDKEYIVFVGNDSQNVNELPNRLQF